VLTVARIIVRVPIRIVRPRTSYETPCEYPNAYSKLVSLKVEAKIKLRLRKVELLLDIVVGSNASVSYILRKLPRDIVFPFFSLTEE
jgi:hypothetical protein